MGDESSEVCSAVGSNSYQERSQDKPLRTEMMVSWHDMSPEEEDLIERLHKLLGDRWELISGRLPDRIADEVEKYWTAKEKKIYMQTKLFKPICTRACPHSVSRIAGFKQAKDRTGSGPQAS